MLTIKDKGIVLQIINRSLRIIDKVSNISKEEFYNNDDIKKVVCFNLFQIGELANALSNYFIDKYNSIPWNQIIGMRNIIVHGYDAINLEIVWNTAIESIKIYFDELNYRETKKIIMKNLKLLFLKPYLVQKTWKMRWKLLECFNIVQNIGIK